MANMTFKASLIPNTDFGYSLGSEDSGNIKRWKIYGKIRRSGVSTNWNKGRDNAVAGTLTLSGYSPAFTVKTTNGSWDIGAYNSTNYIDDLVFSYVSDELYNGTNTTPTQIKFLENGHIVATLDGSATSLTTSGTTAQFYRGDQTWSNEISGGLLKITNNSNTVTIGSANSSWCHFNNSADIPFYFGNAMSINGNLNPYGTTNTRNLGNSSNRWKTLYIGTADGYGDATTPIYWSAGVPTAGTKYAGGTAVTLNGTSKAGSTASFYAPTASGTASTQALVSGGANTAPAWTNISPGITITAGTSSATPKVNVSVLGQSGTAQAITTASTSVYGCTKLTSSYTASDSTLAATGAAIAAAIGTLDVSSVGGTGKYISAISQTDGKISATATSTSVSNAWVAGTTAGPQVRTIVNGVTGAAVAIPTATASASGAVVTAEQTFAGVKHFVNNITIGNRTVYNKAATGVTVHADGTMHLGEASYGGYIGFHWQTASAATAYIRETESGVIRIQNRLVINGASYQQTLGGGTTVSTFQFAVVGNGFVRDTFYTNAALQVRSAASVTAATYRLRFYDNNVSVGGVEIHTGNATTTGWARLNLGNGTASGTAGNSYGIVRIYNTAGGSANITSGRAALGGTTRDYVNVTYMKGTQIWGAVWNDYAEFRKTKKQIEPVRCVIETGKGDMILSTERLQNGAEIISDTFGFAIGQNEYNNTPIAVSGRVLAYLYEDRDYAWNYIGWPVCSGPEGTVSIMTQEEASKYPWKIIGTISEIPNYDKWQIGEKEENNFVNVNGRIWIRI